MNIRFEIIARKQNLELAWQDSKVCQVVTAQVCWAIPQCHAERQKGTIGQGIKAGTGTFVGMVNSFSSQSR